MRAHTLEEAIEYGVGTERPFCARRIRTLIPQRH
jgi:hypothetical protein